MFIVFEGANSQMADGRLSYVILIERISCGEADELHLFDPLFPRVRLKLILSEPHILESAAAGSFQLTLPK